MISQICKSPCTGDENVDRAAIRAFSAVVRTRKSSIMQVPELHQVLYMLNHTTGDQNEHKLSFL